MILVIVMDIGKIDTFSTARKQKNLLQTLVFILIGGTATQMSRTVLSFVLITTSPAMDFLIVLNYRFQIRMKIVTIM